MADDPVTIENLLTPIAVQVQLGETLAGPELVQVEWFIERTCDEMLDQIPMLAERLASGGLKKSRALGVGIDVVLSALDSMRTGLRIKSEQYPESTVEYFKANASELISITPEQIAKLSPPFQQAGAYTVGLGG
jgi:hypothetical protein